MSEDHLSNALNLLKAADRYAAESLVVIPLNGKVPTWKGWQEKTVAEGIAEIRRRARSGNLHNIGIVAGRNSGNLFQFEIDGLELYSAVIEAIPDLKDTFTVRSGGGNGAHIYGRADQLPPTTAARQPGEHLEARFKGEGQQCVAPPSIHPETGNQYTVLVNAPIRHFAQSTIDAILAFIDAHRPAPVVTFAPKEPPRRPVDLPTTPEEEVAQALSYIPLPLPYDGSLSWISILAALKSEFGDTTAIRLAEDWSGWCSKPGEIEAKIASFNGAYRGTPATIASVFHLAKQHGYERPRQQPRKAAPVPELTADLTVCTPYIELPTDVEQHVIAVKSDVGTGKTKANIEAARRAESVMVLTHREKLAQNIVEDANRAGVTLEHYKELARKDWRRVGKLGVCINSYATQAKDGLPVPDLLEIDEIEQMLEHIYGDAGTFSKGEAVLAGEALAYAIRTARRVIVSDAHLSDVAIEYLKANRPTGDVLAMVNTHVADRGALYTHAKKDSAIAAGINLVLQNCGVVAFAYGSEKEARTFATTLSEMVGPDSVLLLRRHNAGGERQQAFLKDPNKEIGKYRAVVYSPVIGTGFDITADVRAVIGIMGAHLTAYDARQMVGRCRAARELHVWLPNTTPTREESAAAIEALELERAEYSHVRLNSAGYAVPDIPQNQRDYVHWHALVMARRNRSLNRLREHFIELSPGYKVQHITAEDAELRQRLQAAAEDAEQQRKALVLTVAPIDREKYQQLENIGTIDDTSAAGYLRWKIEMTAGVTINERVRDALWSSQQRQALVNFTDLLDEVAEVCLYDAGEEAEGVPIPKRKYRRIRRTVRAAFVNVLIDGKKARRLTGDELNGAILPLVDKYRDELRLYFGWRHDQCKGAPAIAKRVLRTIGLTLESEQQRVNGERVRFYQVNQVGIDTAYELGRARRTALEQRRQSERGEDCCLKTHIDAVTSPDVSFKTGPLPPLPRVTPDHVQALGQRLIALHQTTNRSAIT